MMDWPVARPLSCHEPKENLSGRLICDVYAKIRQIAAVQDRKMQIEGNCQKLVQYLVLSMHKGDFEVIRTNGWKISMYQEKI